MTETRKDDDHEVVVRAQVMTRDESTGGWSPLAGGGLALVSIRTRARLPPHTTPEYIIYGQRISDQNVILSCVINSELEYHKVMPTFHHWKAGKQRNGLTFQSAADARAFDQAVVYAYLKVMDGMSADANHKSMYKYNNAAEEDEVFMALELPQPGSRSNSEGSNNSATQSSAPPPSQAATVHRTASWKSPPKLPLHTVNSQPVSRRSSPQREAELNGGNGAGSSQPQPPHPSIHIIAFNQLNPGLVDPLRHADPLLQHHQHQQQQLQHQQQATSAVGEQATAIAPGDNYSYVQLTAVHGLKSAESADRGAGREQRTGRAGSEYGGGGGGDRVLHRDSIETLKKGGGAAAMGPGGGCGQPRRSDAVSASVEKDLQKLQKMRRQCRYCQEYYAEDWNKKGSCRYAPDKCRTAVERVSAIMCARCLVYHCLSDAEGDSVQNPCSCSVSSDTGCLKRWFGLICLSLCCPCLCLYPPLRACHWTCVKCGLCGGKHRPQV